MKDCSQKVFAVDIVSVIVILKSDNLGVGMALGSARFRTVVAEIDYRAETRISFQQIPFSRPKEMTCRAFSLVYSVRSVSWTADSIITVG